MEGIARSPGLGSADDRLELERWILDGALLAADDGRIRVVVGPWRRHAAAPAGATAVYAPDFYGDDPAPWWTGAEARWVSRDALRERLAAWLAAPARGEPGAIAWAEDDPAAFTARVERWSAAIRRGELAKAVPIDVRVGRLGDAGPRARLVWRARLAHAALGAAEGLRPYGLWSASPVDEGIVGATPERLFSREPGGLRTIALAGTARVPEGATPDQVEELRARLLADDKERREHALVVDDLVAQLAPWCALELGRTQVRALPGLLRLETRVQGPWRAAEPPGFAALVARLHPTPALGVAPRAGALERLRVWDDPGLRGRFGAPFGIVEPDGRGLCVVAIRNLQFSGPTVRLAAGCGIVEGAVPSREWRELLAKRASVRALFNV